MHSIGVDLSKNHFGLCRIGEDGKIDFVYLYYKDYLKRDQSLSESWYKTIEMDVKDDNFTFKKIRISYNSKKENQIWCDSLKSKISLKEIRSFLDEKKGSKLIVLEDYVMNGTKVVQLVHVGESFKYQLSERICDDPHILFICPVQTWRKFIFKGVELKTKDPYEKINKSLEIYHKTVYNYIHEFDLSNDIKKEMIDSYCLANIKRYYNNVFMKQYEKRIFIF
jgi:hypothetical protein